MPYRELVDRARIGSKLRTMADRIEDESFGALTLDALGNIFGNEFWLLIATGSRYDFIAATIAGAVTAKMLGNDIATAVYTDSDSQRAQKIAETAKAITAAMITAGV